MPSFDLHVFPVTPRLAGTSVTPELLQVDVLALFDLDRELSLPRFFRDGSGGLIEVRTTVHRALNLDVSAEQMATFTKAGGRQAASQEVFRLLKADGRQLPPGGRAAILMGGIPVDLGVAGVAVDGHVWSVAYLTTQATHKDMAHELGHVFGLDHPYDLRLPPPRANQEYGDFADIMGGQGGWYTVEPSDRPFAATQNLWVRVGAGLSAISLWRYLPGFPNVPAWAREVTPDAAPVRFELEALADSTPNGVRLIVLRGPIADEWYSVQYKARRGWDRAIYSASGSGPGVVQIHQLRNVVWALPDGSTRVVPLPPCLVGEVFPGTGASDWSNGIFSVRVEGFGEREAAVRVGTRLPDVRRIRLDTTIDAVPYQTEPTGEVSTVSRVGPACARRPFAVERTFYNVDAVAAFGLFGFRAPFVRCEVNGVRLGGWRSCNAAPMAAADHVRIPVERHRPTALGKEVIEPAERTLFWQYLAKGLRLGGPQDFDRPIENEGRYDVAIRVLISESPGVDAEAVETTERVTFTTMSIQLPTVVVQEQAACLIAHLNAARTDPRWITPLEEPDWHLRIHVLEALRGRDFVVAGPSLLKIVHEEASPQPGAARRFAELAAALDVSPAVLREVAKQMPLPP